MRPASQTRGILQVTVRSNLSEINPAPCAEVLELLAYPFRRLVRSGNGTNQWQTAPHRFFRFAESGGLQIFTGSLPRVASVLEAVGYSIRIDDRRQLPAATFPINLGLFDEFPGCADFFLTLRDSPSGMILDCRDEAYMADAAGLICRFFSSARVLIPVASKRLGEIILNRLGVALRGDVAFACGRDWSLRRRVTVCTYASFQSAVCAQDIQILIFPDADQAAENNENSLERDKFASARVYGLKRGWRSRDLQSQLRQEGFVGPDIFPACSEVRSNVQVHMVHATHVNIGEESPLGRKRLYWQHDARNRAIAEIGHAISTRSMAKLWELGLVARGASWPSDWRSAAILVETPQHGQLLKTQLPDWPLIDAATPVNPGGWPACTIVTHLATDRMKPFPVQLLVVASGGPYPTIPSGFPGAHNFVGAAQDVRLIDLADHGHPSVVRDTRSRIAEYIRRGYAVDNVPPALLNSVAR